MTENPTHRGPGEMIGRTPIAAWCVTPPVLPDTADNAIGIGAIIAEMVGPSGVSAEPAVELAFPAALVDPDGVVRMDSRTAAEFGRLVARAAASAENGESR